MASVNWRDVQDKAIKFAHEYKDVVDEDKWAKSFWVRFFDIFGVRERSIGSFEERVKLLGDAGRSGKIDFFAPNKFLIEHKTAGKDLSAAFEQASNYFDALKEEDKPRYIIVSDFARFRIYDLEERGEERVVEFSLDELPSQIKRFAFLTEEEVRNYKEEEVIDVKAVRAIGKLHKALKDSNYPPEQLSQLLTRLVFCFFADDTGIFDKNSFRRYLDDQTKKDGSDIGAHLSTIFQVLNTPEDKRQTTAHEILLALPYVNGGLFATTIFAIFGSRGIRDTLMECVEFDWSKISPAVFGSMFQSVMDEKQRHDLGAHYTSEKNIMKVIGPLFLDDFKSELEDAKSEEKLKALWDKLEKITLLDPACGCGNFLVIAYRELRRIEIEIIKRLDKKKKGVIASADAGQSNLGLEMDLAHLSRLSVERMYGIEIESFPAEVAKLSLWLMDHMMNMELGAYYGKPLRKLPLSEAPHIVIGNALRLDWEEVVPKNKLTHIFGNPPFLGYKQQNTEQKADLDFVSGEIKGTGVLDYVTGWYFKSAKLIQHSGIPVAFVSTNSITQGEQVVALWRPLVEKFGVKINFAHQTFKWSNEATGKAAVYCVVIGFGLKEDKQPKLFQYDDVRDEPHVVLAKHINPYLVDGPTIFLEKQIRPLSSIAPKMIYGNEPREGGMLLLNELEYTKTVKEYPELKKWIRRFMSAEDFLNGSVRYCYWLVGASPEVLKLPPVRERLVTVRAFREMSKQKQALASAKTPALFTSIRQTEDPYLLIPVVSSENRDYIPLGYLTSDVIASNATFMLPNATPYHFGILESKMHMSWVRGVCGRLKSDYRYSNTVVYNNFPWPESPIQKQKEDVENAARGVLETRKEFLNTTLADLYNPDTMPKVLLDAHKKLDRAVDACYGNQIFKSEPERLKFLFERYKQLISKNDTGRGKN